MKPLRHILSILNPFFTENFPYFNKTVTIDVRPGYVADNSTTREVQFLCDIDSPQTADMELTADVRWYVADADRRLGPFRIPVRNLPHILHEEQWTQFGLQLGFNASLLFNNSLMLDPILTVAEIKLPSAVVSTFSFLSLHTAI